MANILSFYNPKLISWRLGSPSIGNRMLVNGTNAILINGKFCKKISLCDMFGMIRLKGIVSGVTDDYLQSMN